MRPEAAEAQYRLAWILATSTDQQVRDGSLALELATKLMAASSRREPQYFGLLAAAYATTSQFSLALKTVDQAIKLAGEDEALRNQLKRQRSRYSESKPLTPPN